MNRTVYSLLWYLATPLIVAYLLWRSRRQPAYLRHWRERWSLGGGPADARPLIWIHAVSVGETRAAQPLVAELLRGHPQARLLLSCMTPTGRETAASLFAEAIAGGRLQQVYLPYDYPYAMRAFLRRWRPRIGILLETELWPNLVAQAARAEVPLALVNARLSASSLRKGQRWPKLIGPAARGLALVAAQSPGDAQRIAALGRPADVVTGNMKFDVLPPQAPLSLGRGWRSHLGARAVLLAASTREGEEVLLLDAWQRRATGAAGAAGGTGTAAAPLLVIVPRHPQRFDEVAGLLRSRGLSFTRRSQWPTGTPSPADTGLADLLRDHDVVLGDSMGEMFAWYAMADVAIIGGTLLAFGGQNLIEACAAGVPVLLGPHTYNFAEAAEQAIDAQAALRVADAGDAVAAAGRLLQDDAARDSMSSSAERFAAEHRGATQRTMAALAPWLARAESTQR